MGTSPTGMQVAMSLASNPEHNEGGVMGSFIGRAIPLLPSDWHWHYFMDKKSGPITEAATAPGLAPGVLYSD